METGYLLIADVLGFGRMVRNLAPEKLDGRISGWVSFVHAKAAHCGISQLQLISDTVFASAPSTSEGLSQLVQFARVLLSEGLRSHFPLRGAIVHGTFVWGSLLYGVALIEAHDLEMSQNWIGVSCAPRLPHIDGIWSVDGLICYPAPMKSGPVMLRPVVSWDIPATSELLKLTIQSSAMGTGEVVSGEIVEKVNNTAQLALYKRFLQIKGGSAAVFDGVTPIHVLEGMLPINAP